MPSCTCGKCIGGFLSPATAEAIKESCITSADLVRESMMPFFPTEDAMSVHDPPVFLLDYVPPESRMEVSRQFVEGFASCMAAIAYVLRQGQVPKPSMLKMCATIAPGADKEACRFYFTHGGTMEYVLDGVLSQCECDGRNEEESALPGCANDCRFHSLSFPFF